MRYRIIKTPGVVFDGYKVQYHVLFRSKTPDTVIGQNNRFPSLEAARKALDLFIERKKAPKVVYEVEG